MRHPLVTFGLSAAVAALTAFATVKEQVRSDHELILHVESQVDRLVWNLIEHPSKHTH